MNKQIFFRRSQAVLLAGALAVGIGVVGFAAGHTDAMNPPVVLKLASADEGPSRTGFAPVVKKVLPAVVSVESTKVSKIPTAFEGGAPDDPLRAAIKTVNVRPVANINFNVSVGVAVPRTLELHALPPAIVEIVPAYEGYLFFLVRNDIVVVDPATYEIVDVFPA